MKVFGLLTKPLVGWLLPEGQGGESERSSDTAGSPSSSKETGEEEEEGAVLPLLMEKASSFSILLERPTHTMHAYWRRFDDTYMRPIFGGPI